ncbi:hypothetical protein IV203_002311 [Nitzschia inconspicua]|uniref:Uncharacterized protein n=1 Tax=Nitzschia inconspicua TaxID=303405 RepID=A0A9K3L919_9STRA|nr:hypothetical protein IV203_002311 [Nitzschia inconspicua]
MSFSQVSYGRKKAAASPQRRPSFSTPRNNKILSSRPLASSYGVSFKPMPSDRHPDNGYNDSIPLTDFPGSFSVLRNNTGSPYSSSSSVASLASLSSHSTCSPNEMASDRPAFDRHDDLISEDFLNAFSSLCLNPGVSSPQQGASLSNISHFESPSPIAVSLHHSSSRDQDDDDPKPSLLPEDTDIHGSPQMASLPAASAFIPQQQAEFVDGNSPNVNHRRDYEKVIAERDNFERLAAKYKKELDSCRCLFELGFSGVFHAIDASLLCAQNDVASSNHPGMHPSISSLKDLLGNNKTLRKAEHLLDSDKSTIEKKELALEIIEQFKIFVLTYPGMAQLQNVEPTFSQETEPAKQAAVPTSNVAPIVLSNGVAATDKSGGHKNGKPTSMVPYGEKSKTQMIQTILDDLMRCYDSPSFDKEHYEALKDSFTKDRIGKGQDAELPGGMTLRRRPRKSVIKTDMSFGSEWIRKSKNLLDKHGSQEDIYRLLFLLEKFYMTGKNSPGPSLKKVFKEDDDDGEVEVIGPPQKETAPCIDIDSPSQVARYLATAPTSTNRIKQEVPSPTNIAGLL